MYSVWTVEKKNTYLLVCSVFLVAFAFYRYIIRRKKKTDKQTNNSTYFFFFRCDISYALDCRNEWQSQPHGEKYIALSHSYEVNGKQSKSSNPKNNRERTQTYKEKKKSETKNLENLFLLRSQLYQLQIWCARLKETKRIKVEQQANPTGTVSVLCIVIHSTAHAFWFTP